MVDSIESVYVKRSFWSWFEAHGPRLRAAAVSEPQPAVVEIGGRFKGTYPDLVWEIQPAPDGDWSFCVSADGKRELFPKVLDAVRAAPTVPGWTIKAFRQPGKPGKFKMGDVVLGSDDLFCLTRPKGEGVEVVLWIRGLTRENEKHLLRAAFVLFDNAIGEWDAVMTVVEVHPAPLPIDHAARGAVPLADLGRVLEKHRPAGPFAH